MIIGEPARQGNLQLRILARKRFWAISTNIGIGFTLYDRVQHGPPGTA